MSQKIVGLVSLTDPRDTAFAQERESYIQQKHDNLVQFLTKEGFGVVDPLKEMRAKISYKEMFGVRTLKEIKACTEILKSKNIEALIIGCWHWTEPQLAKVLVQELDVPICLYTERDPSWAGSCNIASAGASLWESAPNHHALTHERIRGNKKQLLSWLHTVCAIEKLKRGSILLWGGSYSLRMEHLRDDSAKLKSFLIGDILEEGEYYLIKRAEKILQEEESRIDRFISWLKDNKVNIVQDEKMLTPEVLKKASALYLAAKDRLNKLEDFNILGVSIKCQNCLSVEYGVTACFLPAFLPFSEDSEGKHKIFPTVCEGDIKGLITAVLLNLIQPAIPPLFGDLKYVGDEYFLLSNCGDPSIYYAYNSSKAKDILPHLAIKGQCHGESGGAVGFMGHPGQMTICRLVRVKDNYFMQMGLGEALPIDESIIQGITYGRMWPCHAIRLDVDYGRLLKSVGSNHLTAFPGDYVREVSLACRETGVPIIRINSNESLDHFREEITRLD